MEELTLYFDTETSGLPNFKASNSDPSQPWIVQLAAVLTTQSGRGVMAMNCLIQANGRLCSPEAYAAHRITCDLADQIGVPEEVAFSRFMYMLSKAHKVGAHNTQFDLRLLKILAYRVSKDAHDDLNYLWRNLPSFCTMMESTEYCKLPYPSGRKGNKWPKLEELYKILFDEELKNAHDALVDVQATIRCHKELQRKGVMA
jgi:DNA polymerase-3 subunit epsilon